MKKFLVEFQTTISLRVEIDAADEWEASDVAWGEAEEYLGTLTPNRLVVGVDASLDGIGAETVTAVES